MTMRARELPKGAGATFETRLRVALVVRRGAELARSLGIASNSQEACALGLSAAVCCYLVSPLLLGLCVAGTLAIALAIRFASSTPVAAEEPSESGEEEPAGREGRRGRGRSRSPRR